MTNKISITLFWIAALFVIGLSIGGIKPVADGIGEHFGFIGNTEIQPFTIYGNAEDSQ